MFKEMVLKLKSVHREPDKISDSCCCGMLDCSCCVDQEQTLPPSWDLETAYNLFFLAKLSYGTENQLNDFMHDYNFNFTKIVNRDESQLRAVVLANDKDIIISFRGSANFENVCCGPFKINLTNEIDKKDLHISNDANANRFKAHSGFYQFLSILWEDDKKTKDPGLGHIIQQLKSENGSRNLWLTGHSMGASLAMLARIKINNLFNKGAVTVYAFGPGKSMNQSFVDYYNSNYKDRTHTVINGFDIFALLPCCAAESILDAVALDCEAYGTGGNSIFIYQQKISHYPNKTHVPLCNETAVWSTLCFAYSVAGTITRSITGIALPCVPEITTPKDHQLDSYDQGLKTVMGWTAKNPYLSSNKVTPVKQSENNQRSSTSVMVMN